MNREEVFTVNRREAPLPPLKGEVAERSEVGGVFQHSARNPSVRFVGSEVPPNLPAPLSGAPLAKPESVSIHPTAPPSVSPFGLTAFNSGMIATGNHNFERFAALCNTLPGEAGALRAGAAVYQFGERRSSSHP